MEKNNNNDIYAILLGLAFLIVIFFILTVSFWEKLIYFLFTLDGKIATLINNFFPQYFSDHLEIDNIVQFAEIPKFDWFQLKFTYEIGPEYINTIYDYYYYLHVFYGVSLIFLGYLILNNFHLIPVFKFQNFKNYKKKLVDEALKRVKIKNKRIILYKHMDVLTEQLRNPDGIDGSKHFLNADYYLPFVSEDVIGVSGAKSKSIKDNFIDVNNVNTNRRYVNDSLFFSNHYINNFYHEILNNPKIINRNSNLKAVKLMDEYWKKIEEKIIDNNDIQDLYYYTIISYYNDEIERVPETFINLFLLNVMEIKNKKFLVRFNNFLKKYKFNIKLIYNYYTKDHYDKKLYSKYVIFQEDQKYNKMNELEKYEFIIDNNYHLNLEEFYVMLKVKLFSFSLNKTFFFDTHEEKVGVPILSIPPSENNNIEKNKLSQLENINEIIDSLKNIQTEEFNELSSIKDKISNFIEFKEEYTKYLNYIYNNEEGKKSFKDILLEHLNKTYITEDEQITVKNLIGENNYIKFVEMFSKDKKYINLIEYLKYIKNYIKLVFNKLIETNIPKENYISDIENLKLEYKKLSRNVADLFEDTKGETDFNKIEKEFYENIIKELKVFMYHMIDRIKLYYKYNLTYNMENKNEIIPEIGQPVMPTSYILTPFNFTKNKNDNNNFEKIKNFKVKGYKKYIYPVFEDIYNNWYLNIEKLIKFYEEKIEKESNSKTKKNFLQEEVENEEIKRNILKLELMKKEAHRQKVSDSSIETKLLDIFEIHKFEETIIIALWKAFTKLENLPTTKLSNLKYENLVLWYALTCIGDVKGNISNPVIGRPFDFNVGLPIILMYELEIENYNRKLKAKNTTEHELNEEE